MLEPEMLVLLVVGAVSPYVSNALWYWTRTRLLHYYSAFLAQINALNRLPSYPQSWWITLWIGIIHAGAARALICRLFNKHTKLSRKCQCT